MRCICVCAAVIAVYTTAVAGEIREFSLPVLEKLGNELSRRDEIAATAADLVFDQHPDFKKILPQGWVTDLTRDGDEVYFIEETNGNAVPAYKVVLAPGKSPFVQDIHGQKIPATIATRYKARQTAINAVRSRLN